MIIFILGLLDILGGTIIIFSKSVLFGVFAKYVGIVLLIKGTWSIIAQINYIVQKLT
jgi:uncharacterized membrane protein HdeD (DUF308 family)